MRAVCLVLSSRRVLRGSIFRSVLMILVVCLHKARSNKIKTYITSCLICVWSTSWFFLVFCTRRMLVRVREGLSLKGDRYRGDLWDTQLCEYGRSFWLREITIKRLGTPTYKLWISINFATRNYTLLVEKKLKLQRHDNNVLNRVIIAGTSHFH